MSNRLQSVREPALPPRAAASQNQVPVSFAVPAAGRSCARCSGRSPATSHSPLATAVPQELDQCIRSMLAAGLAARRFCRRLRLPPYGIRVRAIDRNSRQVYSAGSLPVERLVYRASRPHAKVATSTQRLTGHTFSRSAVAVSKATKGRKDTAQPKACTPNNKGNGVDVVDLLTLVEDFGRP